MSTLKAKNVVDLAGNSLLPPVGVLLPFAGTTAPSGFLICNGAAVSRTTYEDLFDVIGTAFGVGDGSTTFNLPDCQAMVLRGIGDQTVNARTKSGPTAIGEVQEDQMQKITGAYENWGEGSETSGVEGAITNTGGSGTTRPNNGSNGNRKFAFDSGNSPDARASSTTDGETRVTSIGVNYIIKF